MNYDDLVRRLDKIYLREPLSRDAETVEDAILAIQELQRDALRYACVRSGEVFEVTDHSNISDPIIRFGEDLDRMVDIAMEKLS